MQKKILIIDDDPLVLKTFHNLLIREGYEAMAVSSYESAIEVIETKELDLILSDIRMPGRNGVETVREIQSRLTKAGKKDLPIIFITGYAEYGHELDAGFIGEILPKPIDTDKLLMTIREYL